MPSKKPLSDAELAAWESSRDIGAELEQSIREMIACKGTLVPVSPMAASHVGRNRYCAE